MIQLSPQSWRRYVLWTLLGIHILWTCVHMYLGVFNAVNPWKMGGYAMYVEPKRGVMVDVHRYEGGVIEEGVLPVELREFYKANWDFNLYCKPVTERSLLLFMEANPELYGQPLMIELFAYNFTTEPLRTEPYLLSTVAIAWPDETSFEYTLRNCGPEIDRVGVVEFFKD